MANARTPRKLVLAAAAARGLADPTRLRILALLEVKGPLCLMDIMTALDIKQPIASHHTSVLMGLRMLDRQQRGRFMMYSIGRRSTTKVLAEIAAIINPPEADQGGADLVAAEIVEDIVIVEGDAADQAVAEVLTAHGNPD